MRLTLLTALAAGPALADKGSEAVEGKGGAPVGRLPGQAGMEAAFMEGCLESSGGAEGSYPEALEARAFCECMADRLFSVPRDGPPGEEEGMAMVMSCSPGMRELLGDG